MKIAIVCNQVTDADAPDERDVLVQADAAGEALRALGHEVETIGCTLDLSEVRRRLLRSGAGLVFNLVESLEGEGRFIHLFPFLLDALGIAFTGCPAEAQWITSNKIMAKERMVANDLPTPAWTGPYPFTAASRRLPVPFRDGPVVWIIKSLWEHASIGLDEEALARTSDPEKIQQIMAERADRLGGVCFAEQFIDGREFNLSLLAGPDGPETLPPAEIVFEGFGTKKPRIVDYAAKWDETSHAFHHTPRNYDFGPEDEMLLHRLQTLALRCWQVFGLRGYARVDFRVDPDGHPWILEINANPCLSPDAGFAAALERAGIVYAEAIRRILDDALSGVSLTPLPMRTQDHASHSPHL